MNVDLSREPFDNNASTRCESQAIRMLPLCSCNNRNKFLNSLQIQSADGGDQIESAKSELEMGQFLIRLNPYSAGRPAGFHPSEINKFPSAGQNFIDWEIWQRK